MKRLFLIEFDKLYRSRASKILIVSYFTLLSAIALIAAIKFDIGPIKFHLAEQGIFNFPYIWHFNTFMASWAKLFLAVVIVSMIANEYSYKTLKQNLIDGLSKKELVASKVIMIIFLSAASTVFIWLISLILGFSYSNYTEWQVVFMDWEYLLAYFVKHVGFFAFCLFLGVLIKRAAFALGFLGVWQFLELISFGLLHWKLTEYFPNLTPESVARFFPLHSIRNLIKEPFSRLSAVKNVAKQVGESLEKNIDVQFWEIAIVLGWTSLFIWLCYWVLKKRDL